VDQRRRSTNMLLRRGRRRGKEENIKI